MRAAQLRSILILPFNVLLVIPALLLWWSGAWGTPDPGGVGFWLGVVCLAAGLSLMTSTIRRFEQEGEGTLAPWDPTQKLVVTGVYRHVRNPMITGVCLNLLGEALLVRSPILAGWCAVFFAGNAIYMPVVEEPGLERRFGESYRHYKANVPRWIPRLRPWRSPRR